MSGKTPDDMKFWPKDLVIEYDKFEINNQLNAINTNYNFEETSWNPTKIQAFIGAVNNTFLEKFPYDGKLSWTMKKSDNKPVLEVCIRTSEYGNMTVELPIDKLRSKKCPKNLPSQLIDNFIKNFKKKIPK